MTSGAAVNLTFSSVPNIDTGSTVLFQKGSNITSGTPTITFSGGITCSDSNNSPPSAGTILTPTGVNLVINGISSSARTRVYTLRGDTTGNQITGVIANGSGTALNKEGSGTWTLLGNNAYTGATTVSEGTLLVNGSIPAAGLVTVSSGATLGGSGSAGIVTVTNGFLAPGGGADNSFSVASLSLDPAAKLVFGLDDPSLPVWNDSIQVTNDLTLAGQINLLAQPGAPGFNFLAAAPGTQWQIMTYSPGFLSLGSVTIGSAPALSSGLAWDLNVSNDGAIFVYVTPEPSASVLAVLGMFCLLLRRRSR